MRTKLLFAGALLSVACKGGGAASYPGTEEGARAFLTDIRKPGADAKAMTASLKPQGADYAAVFEGELARKAEAEYAKLWSDPSAVIGAKAENSELKLWKATSDEIKAGSGNAREFPGGYQKISAQLKPGVTWYRWKYTKPGEDLGMAFDGLTYINGHWAWFPKPWRVAEGAN